jgi:Tol biopolymer transport system component
MDFAHPIPEHNPFRSEEAIMRRVIALWWHWSLYVAAWMTFLGVARADDPVPKVPDGVVANFARLDRNGDKRLSVDDFRAANAPAQMAVALRDFDLFDRDADGFLSLEEYWSLPTGVSASQRGPLHDPMKDVVDQFVGVLDGLLDDWDQEPVRTIPVGEFLAAFTKALNEPLTGRMQVEADPNRDGMVGRAEARRFVEIQSGVRRSDGQLLRLPDGRLVQHMQFLSADQNQDDRLDKTEFLSRAWSPPGKGPELFEQTDADKDGFVSWLEWSKVRFSDPIAEFRRMDTTLDGQLESAELLAGTPDWCKLSAKVAFPAFDRDRSGKLSLDEFRLTFHANPVANWHIQIADTDLDGLISRQEFSYGGAFPVMRFVYFEMFDANHDGRLDPNEFVYTHKTPREVHVVNADGTGWRKLFGVEDFPSIGSPAVSPDGKRIAFDGHGPKKGLSEQTMLITDFEGGNLRILGLGMMPTWSRDGSQLSYSQDGIRIINADGTEARSLTNGWGAQWSPDGKRIVYYAGLQIMTVDVATEKTSSVYNASDGQYRQIYWNMTWSPDSQRICFKGLRADGSEEVASVSADPDKPRLKVHHSGKNIVADFAWHPGGNRVAFCMFCPERKVTQIYEFNPDAADPPQLLKGQDPNTANTSVCWTPDGKQLIVITGDY